MSMSGVNDTAYDSPANPPVRGSQSKHMELLYIWIGTDETGVIREQGFNFPSLIQLPSERRRRWTLYKIKTIIDNLNALKEQPDNAKPRKKCSGYALLIERIGEPVVRRRLQMLYDEVFPDASQDEYDRYLTEFERLHKSRDPADQMKYQQRLRIIGTTASGA